MIQERKKEQIQNLIIQSKGLNDEVRVYQGRDFSAQTGNAASVRLRLRLMRVDENRGGNTFEIAKHFGVLGSKRGLRVIR